MKKFLGAVVIVFLSYLMTLFVMAVLSRFGPITATIEGLVKRNGGSLWFAAAGVVGVFLVIAILTLVVVMIIAKRLTAVADVIKSFMGWFE